MTLKLLLSIYAATTATILLAIRITEHIRSRTNVDVDCIWRSDADLGNDVLIKNGSTMPVTITNLDVVAAPKKGSASVIPLVDREDTFTHFSIDGLSAEEINFHEMEHFSTRREDGQKVFLRLWIVGRKRPLWLRLGSV